jgi:hypothetical protein
MQHCYEHMRPRWWSISCWQIILLTYTIVHACLIFLIYHSTYIHTTTHALAYHISSYNVQMCCMPVNRVLKHALVSGGHQRDANLPAARKRKRRPRGKRQDAFHMSGNRSPRAPQHKQSRVMPAVKSTHYPTTTTKHTIQTPATYYTNQAMKQDKSRNCRMCLLTFASRSNLHDPDCTSPTAQFPRTLPRPEYNQSQVQQNQSVTTRPATAAGNNIL